MDLGGEQKLKATTNEKPTGDHSYAMGSHTKEKPSADACISEMADPQDVIDLTTDMSEENDHGVIDTDINQLHRALTWVGLKGDYSDMTMDLTLELLYENDPGVVILPSQMSMMIYDKLNKTTFEISPEWIIRIGAKYGKNIRKKLKLETDGGVWWIVAPIFTKVEKVSPTGQRLSNHWGAVVLSTRSKFLKVIDSIIGYGGRAGAHLIRAVERVIQQIVRFKLYTDPQCVPQGTPQETDEWNPGLRTLANISFYIASANPLSGLPADNLTNVDVKKFCKKLTALFENRIRELEERKVNSDVTTSAVEEMQVTTTKAIDDTLPSVDSEDSPSMLNIDDGAVAHVDGDEAATQGIGEEPRRVPTPPQTPLQIDVPHTLPTETEGNEKVCYKCHKVGHVRQQCVIPKDVEKRLRKVFVANHPTLRKRLTKQKNVKQVATREGKRAKNARTKRRQIKKRAELLKRQKETGTYGDESNEWQQSQPEVDLRHGNHGYEVGPSSGQWGPGHNAPPQFMGQWGHAEFPQMFDGNSASSRY